MTPSADKNVDQLKISYVVVGKKYGTIISKIIWQFLLKLDIHLPYDPAITLLDIYARKMKIYAHTVDNACIQLFVVALFKIIKAGSNSKIHQLVNI